MGSCLRALVQGMYGRANGWPNAICRSPVAWHAATSAAKSRLRISCRSLRWAC